MLDLSTMEHWDWADGRFLRAERVRQAERMLLTDFPALRIFSEHNGLLLSWVAICSQFLLLGYWELLATHRSRRVDVEGD